MLLLLRLEQTAGEPAHERRPPVRRDDDPFIEHRQLRGLQRSPLTV
jgi:hypothetical protein